MYMLTLVEVQAFRATGQPVYLDRAALEMTAYLDKLQQTNGLFYHALDVPFFWGRGNGWVAAGMSELLRSLPENHPKRARIVDGYKKMMASLLKFQGADGLWHQLIDHPESFEETSCTGMFTFAMITGVKNGWLDEKTYGPAARKGWLGLVSYINDQSEIREVCEGTNKQKRPELLPDAPPQHGQPARPGADFVVRLGLAETLRHGPGPGIATMKTRKVAEPSRLCAPPPLAPASPP